MAPVLTPRTEYGVASDNLELDDSPPGYLTQNGKVTFDQ